MNKFFVFPLWLVLGLPLVAQVATPDPICANDACPASLRDVDLAVPLRPGAEGPDGARTNAFRAAFTTLQRLKATALADPQWADKYRSFYLGGSNCLRLFELESRLSFEYEQNPAFRAYLDAQVADPAAFNRNGFVSSRRAMNLITRLDRQCPSELRAAEKMMDVSVDELQAVFMKLGQVQGYFDEAGNVIKALEDIPEPELAPPGRLSKKEQIEQLARRVDELPVGPEMQEKVRQLVAAAEASPVRAATLNEQLEDLREKVREVLPQPKGLLERIGTVLGLHEELADFVPDLPGTGVVGKIRDFFARGKRLRGQAEDLVDRADDFKEVLERTVRGARDAGAEAREKAGDVPLLLDRLADLQQQRDELQAKLADKPRRILEELTDEVAGIVRKRQDLEADLAAGTEDAERIRKTLDELGNRKEELAQRVGRLTDAVGKLTDSERELTDSGERIAEIVARLKDQESLRREVGGLPELADTETRLRACETQLATLLAGITGVAREQEKARSKLGRLLTLPGKLLGKATAFIDKHAGLKALLSAIPGVGNLVSMVDGLFGRSRLLAGALEALVGKETKVTRSLEGIAGRIDQLNEGYARHLAVLDRAKEDLREFKGEKTALLDALTKPLDELAPLERRVRALVEQHGLLEKATACQDLDTPTTEVAALEEALAEIEPEIVEIEESLTELSAEADGIEAATAEATTLTEAAVERQEEIAREEAALELAFGKAIQLEPVTVKEWAEGFSIERSYWKANFHPDEEVVKGFKGRYFQVQLKDADKTVKVLFEPGAYYMSKADFRDNYGSVIGAFVTEALASIRQRDRGGIRLFVQGSADITGAGSFRGKLDDSFAYSDLELLPLSGSENFGNVAERRTIPARGFTNDDLPNLRGQFLKEMISIYSKKLQPTLLEGSVKDKVDKDDRNAVIYLFIPAELLASE